MNEGEYALSEGKKHQTSASGEVLLLPENRVIHGSRSRPLLEPSDIPPNIYNMGGHVHSPASQRPIRDAGTLCKFLYKCFIAPSL